MQNFNRYSYANNNPVLYNDPSGHCVNGDLECRDELRETEKKYGVSINDKGGHWTVNALSDIASGMEHLKGRIGASGFKRLFSGVKFSTYSVAGSRDGCSSAMDMCEDPPTRNVRVDVALMKGYDHDVEADTVHELAHVWDFACNRCMSQGLETVTGSGYEPVLSRAGTVVGKRWIPGGQVPTEYATHSGPAEDWADSVRASVDPSPKDWQMDAYRSGWVESQLDAASTVGQEDYPH